MPILSRFKKQLSEKESELPLLFELVLKKINSSEKYSSPDIFFTIAGQELLKNNINTAVFIYSKNHDRFILKHYAFLEQNNILNPDSSIFIEAKTIKNVEEALRNKRPIFFNNGEEILRLLFTNGNFDNENIFLNRLIIAPLTIHSDAIGFICVFAERFIEADTKHLQKFSQKLMFSLTDKILYHEIRETEEKYRQLWEEAPIAYYSLNRHGYVKKANHAGLKLIGYRQEELIGRLFFDFVDSEEKNQAAERFRLRIAEKIPPKKNYRTFIKKDGTKIYASTKYSLEKNDFGEIVGARVTILDYTRRLKAERALKISEEKYRELIDNAGDAVLVFNKEEKLTFANQEFFRATGYETTDLKNLTLRDLLHPEDYPIAFKRFADRLNGKKLSQSYNYRFLSKDKKVLYISLSGSLIKKNNEAVGLQAIVRDISEYNKLIRKINFAKRHYEQVIDSIRDAICVIDGSHAIISSNRAFAQKTGLAIKKIKGKKCYEIMSFFDNNLFKDHCYRVCDKKVCHVKQVFKSGSSISYNEVNTANGKTFYHKISIYPIIDSMGKVIQVVLIIHDITERKIAEEKIRHLNEFNKRILNNAPISIMTLDNNGKIVSTNRYIEKISKHGDYVGKNIFHLHFFKKNELTKKYKRLFDTGESFAKNNCETTKKFGEKKFLNVFAAALTDSDKNITGAVSIALDNTEAISTKEKLEKLNQELEKKVCERTRQLNKINRELETVLSLKSKFISDASHELRTPLTIIQGNVELAVKEKKALKKKLPELYDIVQKEIDRMSKILADLTFLTNADAKTEKLNLEIINLEELLRELTRSINVLAKQKNILITLNKNNSEKILIRGDRLKLEKLFMNIIRNAIKYTENKGIITIDWQKVNTEAQINIEDNGIGIPAEDLPYIFERFYRVDKARSRDEGGTGLGLSICKWIAEKHEGKITVKSEFGKGSRFSVCLPLKINN